MRPILFVHKRLIPVLFAMLFWYIPLCAKEIAISYKEPTVYQYHELYKALKGSHKQILGEAARFISKLYELNYAIEVIVGECGGIDSRYESDHLRIVICYESLYAKVNDYPTSIISKKQFEKRVFQNVMFTFWHEIGHALIHQFGIAVKSNVLQQEKLADEFAVLSMLWRGGQQWKDVVAISALHFKNKSENSSIQYDNHPSDRERYENIACLLYGFAPISYHRINDNDNELSKSQEYCQKYYLARTTVWENYLREHTQRDYF